MASWLGIDVLPDYHGHRLRLAAATCLTGRDMPYLDGRVLNVMVAALLGHGVDNKDPASLHIHCTVLP